MTEIFLSFRALYLSLFCRTFLIHSSLLPYHCWQCVRLLYKYVFLVTDQTINVLFIITHMVVNILEHCCIGIILPSAYSGLPEDGGSKPSETPIITYQFTRLHIRKTITLINTAVITFKLATNSPILRISCSPVSCDRSVPSHPVTSKFFLLGCYPSVSACVLNEDVCVCDSCHSH